MRAHTVTLVENIAWLFGGCDDKGCAKDVWTFDVGTSTSLVSCTHYFVIDKSFCRDVSMVAPGNDW